MFDRGISARRAAREAGLSYPAALKALIPSDIPFCISWQNPTLFFGVRSRLMRRILEAKEREIVDVEPKTKQSYLAY